MGFDNYLSHLCWEIDNYTRSEGRKDCRLLYRTYMYIASCAIVILLKIISPTVGKLTKIPWSNPVGMPDPPPSPGENYLLVHKSN